jgi:TonB family protein
MKLVCRIFFLLFGVFNLLQAQGTQIKFFSNRSLSKEVSPQKAKFTKTVYYEKDSLVTTEVKDLSTGLVILRETFKGEEPYGIWIVKYGDKVIELDYNFELVYGELTCKDSIPGINNLLQDDSELNFQAPVFFNGEIPLYQFISRNVNYPALARESGIQGKVYLSFVLSAESEIQNLRISKGTHILLDKEAMRVLRLIKFTKPARFNGIPRSFCASLPLTFKMT